MAKSDEGRSYIRAFVGAVPPRRLVVLDMQAESEEIWRLTQSMYNASFVWSAMGDFGGTNGMFGDVAKLLSTQVQSPSDLHASSLKLPLISLSSL